MDTKSLRTMLTLMLMIGSMILLRSPTAYAVNTLADKIAGVGLESGSQGSATLAGTLTVTKVADTDDGTCDADCSLREAIATAASGDTITFTSTLAGQTIPLDSELVISKNLMIDGSGLGTLVTISGQNAVRAFNVEASSVVTLNHLSIVSGTAYEGGGIYNQGTLMLQYSILSGNSADYLGGGIYSTGVLTVQYSTLSHNSADSGGGIHNRSWLTVQDSTFSGNSAYMYGGGIQNWGTLTVMNSTISGNQSNYWGGGINNLRVLTVTNSTISGNSANRDGGGIINTGTLTAQNSTFSDNSAGDEGTGGGGGVSSWGLLTVQCSTFSSNSADYGGGIDNRSVLTAQNSTFSGNSADKGGGIFNLGMLTLQSSTLSGNSARWGDSGSIYNDPGPTNLTGTLNYENTIIANSISSGDCYNASGGIIGVNTHNLVEDGSCSDGAVSFLTGDPLLAPLTDNGGGTWTHALLHGSPAIDAVPVVSCAVPTDQRGMTRPQGLACDIGAYELGLPDLHVIKTVSPTTDVPLNGVVTYTLMIRNTGPERATQVAISDSLPAGLTYGQQVNAGTALLPPYVYWGPWDIAPGAAYSLCFTAILAGSEAWAGQTITNTAVFTSANAGGGSAVAAFVVASRPPTSFSIYLPLVLRQR